MLFLLWQKSMKLLGMFFLLVTFAILPGMPTRAAQDQPYSLNLNVSLISLDATVIDAAGRPVTALTREDFQVLEDGVPREIQTFSSVSTPHHILIAIDCSGDEDIRQKFETMHTTMQTFFQALNQPRNFFSAAEFGGKVNLVLDWTRPPWRFVVSSADSACKGADFYGMVNWSLRRARAVASPQSVTVFGDGRRVEKKKVNDRDFKELRDSVQDGNIPFYFVMTNTDRNPPPSASKKELAELERIRIRIESLAEVSGGQLIMPTTASDIVPTAQRLGRELGISYRFGIRTNTDKDGRFHRIEIRTPNRSGLIVQQTRERYSANKGRGESRACAR
jgi:Ca-activated chloride channel family protein